jgi:ribosome maturation protein Sdo1
MIQKALDEIGFSVRADKSAKSQALEGIKKLVESKVIPIQRARMRLRVSISGGGKEGKRVRERLNEGGLLGEVLEEDFGEEYELVRSSAETRLMSRLCWLIQGSIEVFRMLFLRKQKDAEQWKY